MDPLSFIVRIVELTTWPVVSVILVLLLRKEIRVVAPNLRRLKAGPLEVEFERGTEHLAAALESQPEAKEALSQSLVNPAISEVATASPRTAVLEAWLGVETAVNEALTRHATQVGGPGAMSARPSHRAMADTLLRAGLIHEGQVQMLDELRQLRNEVVHAQEFAPTQEAIERYLDSAKYLVWWLRKGRK